MTSDQVYQPLDQPDPYSTLKRDSVSHSPGPTEAWAEGKWMLRNGGIPTLMVSLDTYLAFAREQDAIRAALVSALKHQVSSGHQHSPNMCDGCVEAEAALSEVKL